MKRGAILCLILVCLLSGCGVFRYFDGSSDEEVKKFSISKKELQKEVEHLQSGNEALQKVVLQQQSRIEKFEEKDKTQLMAVSERQTRIESLEKEKNDLLEENKELKAAVAIKEVALVEERTQEKTQTAAAKELRIKVLAGSGGLPAARTMSKKLQDLGYKVERLDRASTTHIKSDTVYHAKDSEKEAKEMAGRLGKETVVKPMTWSSIFDIIVVTR
ncbi:MAG: LytR C-terminal domain-containing protein [Deltaproteobacteria bacterium]|nr:LytR C-terminal domain-containing protein [Deltaproteobacteria bacterium]